MSRGSLAVRLIAAHLLPALLALAGISAAAWTVARRALESELGDRLSSAAGAAGSGLSLDLLLALQPGDEQTRTYRHAQEQLGRALAATGLRRLAVFTPDGHAVVDSAGTPIGALLADLSRDQLELRQVWSGHPTASSLLFQDAGGRYYKTGYAPLRLGDRVAAGIMAEGSAGFFDVLGQLRRRLLWLGLAGALLIALASLLAARTVTGPVRTLALASERIGGGDLVTPVEPATGGGAELAILSHTLEDMRRALQDRQQEMQMMLSGIAHEVRNPLGGIELFAGLLQESLPADGEAAQHVRRVQQELAHLKVVVEDFLGYAREAKVELQPVSPRATAEEIVALVEQDLAAKQLRCELSVAGDLPFPAEPVLLRRALLNLVQNAIQSSPPGGPLRLSHERRGAAGVWVVEDAGPGVPEEKRDEIFKPFYTTRQRGTGLGLAFVKKIADAHGGTISVGPSPLGGARFELSLPLAAA
ncbi:MAG TPA: HAMP domain-containing sensor histidine kinase [Myxococcales bacterium]|nr:HAMP domain-containing sensor histidine kinase [Myxococcales bacterium]